MLYQSRGGENGQMQKTELVWAAVNLRLQGRNPNAGHVSFWEGVKSEGKFGEVVQRSPTVPTAGDKGDLGSGNRLTADGVVKLPADEEHTGD